ncbi:MAG: NAD(P)/FAD-dependent oxidoreductase, partial [Thermoanaerobaculia bacterium]
PVALDISRHWLAARASDAGATLSASFLPGESLESLEALLRDAQRVNPRATLQSVFRGRIPERLLDRIVPPTPLTNLSKELRRTTIRALTKLTIPVERDRGFEYAEVTAGGVPLAEVDPSTMQSRICPGLYLCGEILDVDGRIGGFNFQWAWASGRLAGLAAALRSSQNAHES